MPVRRLGSIIVRPSQKHPWTNGQVERINRTTKDATVKRFHYDDHDQLRHHLADFISSYNFGRRLKTLKGLTPYEFICKRWTTEPERFSVRPVRGRGVEWSELRCFQEAAET